MVWALHMKTESFPNPLQLTRMIFDYWLNWMSLPERDMSWVLTVVQPPASPSQTEYPFLEDREGLFWYDGHNATFWYMLNVAWYQMNNTLYDYTSCKEPFDNRLQGFDPEYLAEYYS